MKNFFEQFSQILGTRTIVLVATVACVSSPSAVAETVSTETNSAPTELTVRKSVFEDNLKNGKDPFYPRSARRDEKLPVANTKVATPVVQLSLKGISGPTNRRFALINNQPLAAGETAFVRVPGGQVRVHCWEIREDSVVISVEGNPEKRNCVCVKVCKSICKSTKSKNENKN